MPDIQALLNDVRSRNSRSGLVTADRYFREVEGCFDGSVCPVAVGADSEDGWRKALKEAESKLTYSGPGFRVRRRSIKEMRSKSGILQFDAIITTPRRDRDGDILLTKGATVDVDMPLLWQHITMQPIGRMVRVLSHTERMLKARFVIANTDLGRDAAELIKVGGLRISHGFIPNDYELLDDEQGWLFRKYEIYETSVVSVPSNVDAKITDLSEKSFRTSLAKGYVSRLVPSMDQEQDASAGARTPPSLEKVVTKSAPEPATDTESPVPDKQSRHGLVVAKEFDVERQHLEAAKLEYDWISRFCSCEVKQLVNLGTSAARIRMGSFLTGLKLALKDSVEVDARRLTSSGMETPLEYETIQLNSEKSDNFMVDGISFRKFGDGTCFAVKFSRSWSGESVEVFSSKKDGDKVSHILCDAWKWADENNFLKKEAFSLSGEFISKTDEQWENVFLTSENKSSVKRTVQLLNQKGKGCPNRGVVMMGPPGTGKTLSGRIMRNTADATFIWVGGKDAYYFGGTNAVIQAFELAKELAPAVVFMEDIDAALHSSYAIDVMKTEMDGIGRSSGIVTVMTTNHPKAFPEALLDRPGRFHDVLKFDLPSDETRNEMLRNWLPDLTDKARVKAVESTKGYSGAHVYELCEYAKTIQASDEVNCDESVLIAIKKIDDQRDLISQELTSGRRYAERKRAGIDTGVSKSFRSREVSKSFVASEPEPPSFEDIQRQFVAELATRSADEIRKSHRLISLLLRSAEEQEEAREFDEMLSQILPD